MTRSDRSHSLPCMLAVLVTTCRSVDAPPPVVSVATATPVAPERPAVVHVSLEPGLSQRPFTPGLYATGAHKAVHGTHHTNVYDEDTRAAMALDFADDGGVTGCRSLLSRSTHYTDRGTDRSDLRARQGYRGRWVERDGWVEVDLGLDASVCRSVAPYTNLAPKPWHLRCVAVAPQGHARLTVPALVCQLTNRANLDFSEEYGLQLDGVLAEPAILLGGGHGLELEWEGDSVVPPEDAPVVTTRLAARRIDVEGLLPTP